MRCYVLIVAVLCSLWCTTIAIDVQSTLDQVPADERIEFINYYAQRGYDLLTQQGGVEILNSKSFPDEFAINLYEYLQSKEIICFEDGTCVDIGDTGVYPED